MRGGRRADRGASNSLLAGAGLATADQEGIIHIWDMTNNDIPCLLRSLRGHSESIIDLAYGPFFGVNEETVAGVIAYAETLPVPETPLLKFVT